MSLATFLRTIELDLSHAFHTVEADAESAFGFIWSAVRPVFTAFEPTLISQALGLAVDFLSRANSALLGGSLADLETAFLMDLEAAGHVALDDVKGLGSNALQVVIGLARQKLNPST